ncbi:MAG: hypothetical protein HY822_17305 [Acidobacteria bacterium]|nr:hypothetical protein [Acidobacteriota bacterium]
MGCVRELSTGEAFRSVYSIYFHHFFVLFGTYIIPLIPAIAFSAAIQGARHPAWGYLDFVVGSVMGRFAFGGVTLLIGDLCARNLPSLSRCLRKAFGRDAYRLAGVSVLQLLLIVIPALSIGCLAALTVVADAAVRGRAWSANLEVWFWGAVLTSTLLGGTLIMLRYGMAVTVVVLEGRSVFEAMRRSKFLTRGFLWHMLRPGLALAVVQSALLVSGVLILAFAMGDSAAKPPWWLGPATTLFLYALFLPFCILFVVLYFDLRARKEAYDARALSEDLKR